RTARSITPSARARTASRSRARRARARSPRPEGSAQARDVLGERFHVVVGELRRERAHHGMRTGAGRIGLEPSEDEFGVLAGEARILRRDAVAGRAVATGTGR